MTALCLRKSIGARTERKYMNRHTHPTMNLFRSTTTAPIAIDSINRTPLRRAFFLIPLVLACFAFWPGVASSQVPVWIPIFTPPQFNVGVVLLLTDGSIMVQENKTPNWYKLIPDKFGFYRSGTWHRVASMPSGYKPLFFASAVLKNGHVIIEGGEYNNGIKDWTNLGAIYDPVANTWTPVSPPAGWSKIGDAPSVVLPDGTFMLGNCCDNPAQAALLDEASLTWTVLKPPSGFAGKFDRNNEEGWNLLPNGTVLTVDTYNEAVLYDRNGTHSEIYNTGTKKWTSAGSTVVQLWDSKGACGGPTGATHEIGPAVLRPDGTVFATGSNTCKPGTAGHTATFDTTTKTWTRGHDIPSPNASPHDAADAPAAILPDGNVLVDTNPRWGVSPSTLYEYKLDGTGWKHIPQPTGLNPSNTEGARMLVTPDGTILLAHVNTPQIWFYVPAGTYRPSWRPTITSCPATVTVGSTYTVSGTQFNGLSQGAAYGDDAQSATNYPIVRIRNNASGEYHFARTHGFSTMAVATGNMPTSTKFDVLPGTQSGLSTLQVIANGIPSAPRAIHVINPGR